MARIGIVTCSNVTQDLECSSVACLEDLRNRKGAFARYSQEGPLDLVGIINCPGCPTLVGPEKFLRRLRGLTAFRVETIHFSNCLKNLCPFKGIYQKALESAFPEIRLIMGTHQQTIATGAFREGIKKLLGQPRKTMIDAILGQ